MHPAATKLKTEEQKITKTVMDTIEVTPELVKKWRDPPIQRPLKINRKVREVAEEMRIDTGVWKGVVTLGIVGGEIYLIDGQHRRAAFLMTGLKEGYCDVRVHYMNSVADMGEEFVLLNTSLVAMGPDDKLRALEPSMPILQMIRQVCPYVGYDSIRRNEKAPMLSMSTALRSWWGSMKEVPVNQGMNAQDVAHATDEESAAALCEFLHLAHNAFGRDPVYYRMWGALNLTLCMWLYRRMVLDKSLVKRATRISKEQFQKAMMALTASEVYVDWLHGRTLTEAHRSPCYARMSIIMSKRLTELVGQKVRMPSAPWVAGSRVQL
jgi:hypothetical protein